MNNDNSTEDNSVSHKEIIQHDSTSQCDGDQLKRRRLQHFFLIWVDSSIDESTKDYHEILTQLQSIVNFIYKFTTINSCINFLPKIGNQKVFLIVSSDLSQSLIPLIHHISQFDVIYIYHNEKTVAEESLKDWCKVKGIYPQIASIYDTLKKDIKQCNQNNTPISFVQLNSDQSNPDLNQLDPSFMYTQLFKEIILKNQYDQKSTEDMIRFCRQQYSNNPCELRTVLEFEKEYTKQLAVCWYTRSCFTFEIINEALRSLNTDIIIIMSFFIKDLHNQIEQLYFQQYVNELKESFKVYRGQGLSESEFTNLMKTEGGLMSFNSFLSTSMDPSVANIFAESNSFKMNTIGIVFEILVNPSINLSPFARIDNISYHKEEKEILFSMHTIFRIGKIEQIGNNTRLWRVSLELTSDTDPQLTVLADQIRKEVLGSTGYERLGKLLVKIGQWIKAEELYLALLNQTDDEEKQVIFYRQLGDIRDQQNDYENAIIYYEKARTIKEKIPYTDRSELSTIYMSIGATYMKMEDHTKAKSFIDTGTEILQINSFNHPDLTISYLDIGDISKEIHDYSTALLYQEKSLERYQTAFPPNHPHLATTYNNIGVTYHNMKEYSKALLLYEKSLAIFKQSLPSNHPSLATVYNNIGAIYKNFDDYPEALSLYEKAFAIRHASLSPNHSDLGTSYTNIGMLYDKMADYAKALSYLEKGLAIFHQSLPSNNLDLQATKENIELIRRKASDTVDE